MPEEPDYANMFVSRERALEILAEHGIASASAPTAYDSRTHSWAEDSTFNQQVGVKHHYTLKEIRDWLGY